MNMANICINRFYCSTDNEANYEKLMYALDETFGVYGLDGDGVWMRGEFESKWTYPESEVNRILKSLDDDPTLCFEVVSFEPGLNYLEAHTWFDRECRTIP